MTCGKGLAEHSAIPLKLGELIDALAENLDRHLASLTADNPATRAELQAYTSLLRQQRDIAKRLADVGNEMLSYRSLAMGPHDEKAFEDPAVSAAFEGYLAMMRQTIAVLQASLTRDEKLLG